MRRAKQGQMTLLFAVGFVIIILMGIFYYLLLVGPEPEVSLAEIESVGQAADAVEMCIDDMVHDAFFALGEHGGYVDTSFSSFGTAYELIPITSMEDDLETYLGENIGSCADMLDGTPFTFAMNGRPTIDAAFADTVTITVSSLGSVMNGGTSQAVSQREMAYDVDFVDLYNTVEMLSTSPYGIPIENYDAYIVNTFVDAGYTEQLIQVYHIGTGFRFRFTKKLA